MDENVLKKLSLCEAFKHIIPIDQLQQDFSKAFITKLNYHKSEKESNSVWISASRSVLIKFCNLKKHLQTIFLHGSISDPALPYPFPKNWMTGTRE